MLFYCCFSFIKNENGENEFLSAVVITMGVGEKWRPVTHARIRSFLCLISYFFLLLNLFKVSFYYFFLLIMGAVSSNNFFLIPLMSRRFFFSPCAFIWAFFFLFFYLLILIAILNNLSTLRETARVKFAGVLSVMS